ncbi:guanine-1-methyltransferase-domain-containing protein [Aspergillus karnatakaensis]|uniref:tRNA (guanine(9)-N(1))-methyltransferase n=1 Tax=Aspergillus karnatakaensis TaxID=1810916 RepID=UPI003CCCE833
MEEEERPRKFQKLDAPDTHDTEPLMTGAISDAPDIVPEQADNQNAGVAATTEKKTEEASTTQNESEPTTQNISKRQLRRQLQREQWESERELRKVKRKEKAAARKERKRAAWQEAKEQGRDTKEELQRLFPSSTRTGPSTRLPLTLIIDCGFDDLMMVKERISLAQQLTRSYSENHKSPYQAHMVISSFDKLLKERFETVLHKTHDNWKGIRFIGEDWLHAAKEAHELMQGPRGGKMAGPFADKTDAKPEDGEIVYLSSDSSETLTELKPYSTYIIGGLVDKNRHKGICHKRATDLGIKTAKLPIGEYIQMASRSVLATNHVVEIMVRWLQLQDWGEAFMQTLPARKGGTLRNAQKQQGEATPEGEDAESNHEQETAEAAEVAEGEAIEAVEAMQAAEAGAPQNNDPTEKVNSVNP